MIRVRGFTLIEVLVALVIVAVSLPAILKLINQSAQQTTYVRESLFATYAVDYVVQNRRLHVAQQQWQADSGTIEMMGERWYWWVEESPTQMGSFVEITTFIGQEKDDPLAQLVSYEVD